MMIKKLKFLYIFILLSLNTKILSTDLNLTDQSQNSYTSILTATEYIQDTSIIIGFASCGVERAQKSNTNIMVGGMIAGLIGFALDATVKKSGEIIAHQIGIDPKIGSLVAITCITGATLIPVFSNGNIYKTLYMRSPHTSLTKLEAYVLCATIMGIVELVASADITLIPTLASILSSQIGINPEIIGKIVAGSRLLTYCSLIKPLLKSIKPEEATLSESEVTEKPDLLKALFIDNQFSLPILLPTLLVGGIYYYISTNT